MAEATATPATKLGENVLIEENETHLIIKIEKAYRGKENVTKSGNTTVRVASTLGNKEVADGIFVGVNAYVYKNKK